MRLLAWAQMNRHGPWIDFLGKGNIEFPDTACSRVCVFLLDAHMDVNGFREVCSHPERLMATGENCS